MKTKKLQLWPFVLLSILFIGCALFTAWYFQWWGWVLPWQILSISAVAIISASLLSSLCYWLVKLNRAQVPSDDVLAERERIKGIERAITAHFNRADDASSRSGDNYKTPWYLLFSDAQEHTRELLLSQGLELLDQEDRDDLAPLSFWRSDQIVVVAIEQFESPYFEEGITRLLQLFEKRRARQGVNGVLLGLSAAQLMQQQQSQVNERAKHWRNLLGRCNSAMGLNLPCYTLVTDFSALSDLQRLFSCFDDERLEQPLGALSPAAIDGFDEQWFEQSYSQIQQQLLEHTTRGLKAQLNPEYRDSIVMGPYQFSLLKTELGGFLRQLFDDSTFADKGLNFRGYFFSNIGAQANSIDKLTMLLSAQLGYQQALKSETEPGKVLFSKGLFNRAILPESRLVGVNRRRERRYRFWGWSYGALLLAGIVAAGFLLESNYSYYSDLNAKAQLQLVQYRENLQVDPPNIDDLTGPIYSLSDLRKIREIYRTAKPWYVLAGLPNPSIEAEVEQSYEQALDNILLTALRDYLLKDMFVYNKLEDKLKTIELYNLYQLLYNPKRVNKVPLINYYVSSLQAEGESDISTIERFRTILADALRPGVVPQKGEQTLINIVKDSLSQDDISELLYQHIMQRPQMSQRIDLRQSLGQKAQLVFSYSEDDSPYLMPRIFTREGFEQLLKGDDFQLATKAIGDFEGIIGKVSSASQISRINRELKQRYISDYIASWQTFYRNVKWRDAQGSLQVRNQLNLITDSTFSPLKKLQMLMSYHTNLNELAIMPEVAEGAEPAQRDLERSEIAKQIAQEIGRPFTALHSLVTADDQGITPIDAAIAQLSKANLWLETALAQQPRGADLLQQLSASAGVNPLEEMTSLAGSYNDRLIAGYLTRSANELNTVAMLEVRSFINDQWRRNVYSFYRSKLAGFYPFNTSATQDVSAQNFNQFFAVDGMVDRFSNQFLGYFNVDITGQRNMGSFLSNSNVPFNDELSRFLVAVKDIQQRMYSAGVLKVDFEIRAQDMSSALSEISLYSERKIYSYRNGPPLWASVQWPEPQQSSEDIELQLKSIDKHILRASFVGFWSWFKLADTMQARTGKDPAVSVLTVKNQGQSAVLVLRVNGAKSPFTAGYFSKIKLPSAL